MSVAESHADDAGAHGEPQRVARQVRWRRRLILLGYLLRRDRHLIWRPGKPPPELPADAPIGSWGAIIWRHARHRKRFSGAAVPE